MLSDPQSITVDGDTITLPRTGTRPEGSVYSAEVSGAPVTLTITNRRGKRRRHEVRLRFDIVVPDPLYPSTNIAKSASLGVFVDAPLTGISNQVLENNLEGLLAYLSANSGSVITKVLGGES